MSAVDHLRRIPLFADLTAEEMVDVLRMATVVQVAPEQKLCTQGSPSDCLFILEDGQGSVRIADAQGRVREVSRIGPGEVLGELGLVDGQARSADVVAITSVRAYRLDRAQFDRMRAAMNPAAYKMLRRIALTVSERLRAINSTVSEQIAPNDRPSRVTRDPAAPTPPTGRVSRVNTAPIVQPTSEPEERSLLRSVLARFKGGGK
jgi:CRP-like cAMP-binding protein